MVSGGLIHVKFISAVLAGLAVVIDYLPAFRTFFAPFAPRRMVAMGTVRTMSMLMLMSLMGLLLNGERFPV